MNTIPLWQFKAMDTDELTDAQLAENLSVSVTTIERYRRATGRKKKLPYKGIHPSKRKIKIRTGHIGKWTRNPHPKGMLGKNHTEENKAKQSDVSKAMWKDPNHVFHSEEFKQRQSDRAVATQFKHRFSQTRYSRSISGKRADLDGRYFRSAWEANYARYLNFLKSKGNIWKWEYEVDTFWFEGIKRGCRFYTPDFKVWDTETSEPIYHEVKGWMDQKSKTKLDRMGRYHPKIKIILIQKKEYDAIKQYSALLPGWE